MDGRVGIWVIGACGGVSTCMIAGIEAMKAGLISRTGLVTELEEFRSLSLVRPENLVFGGHEIRSVDLVQSAEEFSRMNGVLTSEILKASREGLVAATKNLRPGITLNSGKGVDQFRTASSEIDNLPILEIVSVLKKDLEAFQQKNKLDDLVVVNLASAEPDFSMIREYGNLEMYLAAQKENRRELFPASVLYAQAAIEAGYPYMNFTSSVGSNSPALDELARKMSVPHMGRDAKTGETLVKTTLAPMFTARNLKVLSWQSQNLLGNRDGMVLEDPDHKKAKLANKDQGLRKLLGDEDVHSQVRIDYVPSLGDWKTAWDFIHFEGFLGTRMQLQFTWQGCDSALAAPLVIDLVRFLEFAHRRGESGLQRHLSPFFKAPYGVDEQDFATQMEMLYDYAQKHRIQTRRVVRSESPS
jgi:myo-inositol-1-phosphate synthase